MATVSFEFETYAKVTAAESVNAYLAIRLTNY